MQKKSKIKTLTDVVLELPNPDLSLYSQFKSGSIVGEYGSKKNLVAVVRRCTFNHYGSGTVQRKWGVALEKCPSLAQLLTKLYCVLEMIDTLDPTIKDDLEQHWDKFQAKLNQIKNV